MIKLKAPKIKTIKKVIKPLKLKAKHKRKIKNVVLKKKLFKRKTTKKLIRSLYMGVLLVSTGSLAYAITIAKPVVEVNANKPGKVVTLVAPTPTPLPPGAIAQSGKASWYAWGLPQPDALTCASTRFPRRTHLEVTHRGNGRKVICRVNDYGPEAWTGRVIDLSRGSFVQLDNLGRGVIMVDVRVVSGPAGSSLTIPNVIGEILGYQLCGTKYSADWCETNRQSEK